MFSGAAHGLDGQVTEGGHVSDADGARINHFPQLETRLSWARQPAYFVVLLRLRLRKPKKRKKTHNYPLYCGCIERWEQTSRICDFLPELLTVINRVV